MREETVKTDITVAGGGLAGICAAIAAARMGRTVALVQNRPVLGGNSSSEVRVWVSGANASGVNRYARETGIMGEFYLENQFTNPEGNPYLWDLVLLEAVKKEKNIQLFLNTDIQQVETMSHDRSKIASVTGWMMGSERRITFQSSQYIDCTGDGLVGELAGAEYRLGRESRDEYDESLAPEQADDITLGSTILFYTKDIGRPVRFVAPSFAKNIEETAIPMRRVIRSGDSGCHYWWIEWGGELDSVHDNERIRDELWSVIYGIWDYIKNSGKFEADHLTLEWVGSVPGKREYRRFMGDHLLTQNEIVAQTPFEDRIGFGGWSIDLHPPQGMYAAEGGSKHLHPDGVYHIPFGCLYSRNMDNLLFAGRNISATHIAFGSTRVMATCAVMGEAAGAAAAMSVVKHISPAELHQHNMHELQQEMLRADASMIGIQLAHPDNLAHQAVVTASGYAQHIGIEESDQLEAFPLTTDAAVLFPVDPVFDGLECLVSAQQHTTLRVEVWDTGKAENYIPHECQATVEVDIQAGDRRWVTVPIAWKPESAQNAFVIIRSNDQVSLHLSENTMTGVLSFQKLQEVDIPSKLEDRRLDQPVVAWSMKALKRKKFCFRVNGSTKAYLPQKTIDGYLRPYGGPHMWLSEVMTPGQETWIEYSWDSPKAIREITIIFNDDVNEYLNNLHFIRTPFDVFPELVRDYRIEIWNGEEWDLLEEVHGNRRRKQVHRFEQAVKSDKVRVVVTATNGSSRAEIIEVMVF